MQSPQRLLPCRTAAALAVILLGSLSPAGAQELIPGQFLEAQGLDWEVRPAPRTTNAPFTFAIDFESDPDPAIQFELEAEVAVSTPAELIGAGVIRRLPDGREVIDLDETLNLEVDLKGELTNRNGFPNAVLVGSKIIVSESEQEDDRSSAGCLGDGFLAAGAAPQNRSEGFMQRAVCRVNRMVVRRSVDGMIDGLFYIHPQAGYVAPSLEDLSRFRFSGVIEVAYRFTAPPEPEPEPEPEPRIPTISSGGVVDAARFQAKLAPGGLASAFGVNLADGTAAAARTPLPTELAGVRVLIDGVAAPLIFVSPTQVNFQAPFEIAGAGAVEVQVVRGDETGPAVQAAVMEFAPQVFVDAASGTPAIIRADGRLVTRNQPVRDGDVLVAFLTGVGGVINPPATGALAPGDPPAAAVLPAVVTLGGLELEVFYAGLTPNFVGLAQVNFRVRAPAQGARLWPLVIRFGEAQSLPVDLPLVTAPAQ